jgi:hypothetical protein
MFALVFDYITDTHVGPIRESSLCSESGEFVYRRQRVAATDGRRKVVNEPFLRLRGNGVDSGVQYKCPFQRRRMTYLQIIS